MCVHVCVCVCVRDESSTSVLVLQLYQNISTTIHAMTNVQLILSEMINFILSCSVVELFNYNNPALNGLVLHKSNSVTQLL